MEDILTKLYGIFKKCHIFGFQNWKRKEWNMWLQKKYKTIGLIYVFVIYVLKSSFTSACDGETPVMEYFQQELHRQ